MQRILILLIGSLILVNCSDERLDSNAIRVQGSANLSNAAEAAGKTVDGQALLIINDPQRALGESCPEETQHRSMFQTQINESGAFDLTIGPNSFEPVSHPDCQFTNDRSLKIRALRISLNLPEQNLRATGRADEEAISRSEESGWFAPLNVTFESVSTTDANGEVDLRVDESASAASWAVETRIFSADSCAVRENCVNGTGERTLLTFDSAIINAGTGPLVVGEPEDHEEAEFGSCHAHFHLGSVMSYELIATDGSVAATGRKQGFCLMDSSRVSGSEAGQFDCENQGISPGWEDVYDRALDCQWIDITGVAPGEYRLRLTANPDFIFEESDFTNNRAEIPVSIETNANAFSRVD